MKDAMSSTENQALKRERRAIQEIADQFKIPVEEAEKRLASMTDSIRGSSEQSEEVRRRKAEAISKLPPPRGGHGSAVKVTIGLNKLEAETSLNSNQLGAQEPTRKFSGNFSKKRPLKLLRCVVQVKLPRRCRQFG